MVRSWARCPGIERRRSACPARGAGSVSGPRRRIRISPSAGTMPVRAVMFTWWVTSTTGRLSSAVAIHACSARLYFSSSPGDRKKELSAGSSTTGPTASPRAVSRQRHHWLLYTVVSASPAARSLAPIRAACLLPSSERFRWVVQSPSRKSAGSPVPGALAWRSTMRWSGFPISRARSLSAAPAVPGRVRRRSARMPVVRRKPMFLTSPPGGKPGAYSSARSSGFSPASLATISRASLSAASRCVSGKTIT